MPPEYLYPGVHVEELPDSTHSLEGVSTHTSSRLKWIAEHVRKGFEALIKHLKGKGIFAARHSALGEILVLMNRAERIKLLPAHFKAHPANRPKTRTTLEAHVQAVFGRTLSPEELGETIQDLVAEKIITLSEKGAVAYTL